MMQTQCPHCKSLFEVDDADAGKKVPCPECGGKFFIRPYEPFDPDKTQQGIRHPHIMEELASFKTQQGIRHPHIMEELASFETMPGRRDRKPDGLFEPGDLIVYRYEVLSKLGQGGMGAVFKCFDKVGGIEIALKALPPELAHDPLKMKEIKENFQLIHNLHHPNIASVNHLEIDNSNGNYYLIMECVNGENLRSWLERKRRGGALSLADVLPIVRQVASALDYAHKEGLIHRDVKPGNVMIDAAGDVKVLDFGLAAQIQTGMARGAEYGETSGTGPYMAPEQWRGKAQGAAADQYALAVMTYEMLAGHLPFGATDSVDLQQAVLTQTANPIKGLSAAAQKALARALAKEPQERFESCAAFVAALDGKWTQKVRWSGNAFPAAAISIDFTKLQKNSTALLVAVCKFGWLVFKWLGSILLRLGNAVVKIIKISVYRLFRFIKLKQIFVSASQTVCKRISSDTIDLVKTPQASPATVPPIPKKRSWKCVWLVLVLVLVLVLLSLAGATGGYWLLSHRKTAASAKAAAPGDQRVFDLPNGVKLELLKVEAGSFTMSKQRDGENFNDEKEHQATLTRDFYLGKTEVTQAQWQAIMGSNPSYFKKGDNYPVEEVSWNDAMRFCDELNRRGLAPSGWKFTLPTETQWEYAAVGGKRSCGYKYSGSNTLSEVGWYKNNSQNSTHPVGQRNPNELGFYDMSGNIWEWCLDDYDNDSRNAQSEFSRSNDQGGSYRVIRGGSWCYDAGFCRSAYRFYDSPGLSSNCGLGFRVALVPERY